MTLQYYPVQQHSASRSRLTRRTHVQWGWLYCYLPLLVGLLLVVRQAALTRTEYIISQCVIVLLVHGLIAIGLQGAKKSAYVLYGQSLAPNAQPKVIVVTPSDLTLSKPPALPFRSATSSLVQVK